MQSTTALDETQLRSELRDFLNRDQSFLGRLIAVAGLWNNSSGRYDVILPERFRAAGMDREVAGCHKTFFTEWLSLSLEEKEADLVSYWQSLGRSVDYINRIGTIAEAAIPPLTDPLQRQDYIHDLILITALLRYRVAEGTRSGEAR